MKVNELQARMGKVDITLDVTEVGDIREFEKFGNTGKVANAVAKDETGQIKLTLWNEQTGMIKAGQKVKITNGYVGEYQGELQLSTGKFGNLEVIDDDNKSEGKPDEEQQETQEEPPADEPEPEQQPKTEEETI